MCMCMCMYICMMPLIPPYAAPLLAPIVVIIIVMREAVEICLSWQAGMVMVRWLLVLGGRVEEVWCVRCRMCGALGRERSEQG